MRRSFQPQILLDIGILSIVEEVYKPRVIDPTYKLSPQTFDLPAGRIVLVRRRTSLPFMYGRSLLVEERWRMLLFSIE